MNNYFSKLFLKQIRLDLELRRKKFNRRIGKVRKYILYFCNTTIFTFSLFINDCITKKDLRKRKLTSFFSKMNGGVVFKFFGF